MDLERDPPMQRLYRVLCPIQGEMVEPVFQHPEETRTSWLSQTPSKLPAGRRPVDHAGLHRRRSQYDGRHAAHGRRRSKLT